ncbi:Metallo-dependent phosphatase [Rostrohypoxylon terebratum]|nr:Metallo-dependent phosphatase [Rostrohypoxylon terebratum]
MGRPNPLPPVIQRRKHQRIQLVGSSIILAILTLILFSYTRSSITLPNILTPMANPDPVLTSLPDLTHPTLLADLPSSALPKPGHPGRLIVIGDVHGHLSALDALLAKVDFDASRGDHVVFAGDIVNKGPDSPGVVDRAIEIGAFSVRGNHEDRVLKAWKKMHKKGKKGGKKHAKGVEGEEKRSWEEEEEEIEPEEDDGEVSESSAGDRSTAASLTAAQVTWLAKLPVILRVGPVSPHYGDVVVVHAGLVPGIPLKEQDPWAAMHMRTLISRSRSRSRSHSHSDSLSLTLDPLSAKRPPTFKPSEGHKGRPWAKVWNEAQKQNAKADKNGKGGHKTHKQTVVYGHDAKVGLSVRRYAFGLDSGCARGRRLTALVFEPTSDSKSASAFASKSASASTSAFESGSESESGSVYTSEEEREGEDSGGDESDGADDDVAEMAKHGISHRLVSVRCEKWSGDKGGKKKHKHKHHKDKGKDGKKHKDQD